MYKLLKLNDFRQFKDMDISLGKRLTVLAGRNSTGKSTILGILAVTVQNPSGSMTNCCAKQRIEKIFSALNCCCFVDKNDDLLSIYPPCG